MKTILTVLLIFAGYCIGHADTIDYYHVYYKGKRVGDFKEGQQITITLKSSDVAINDSIFVDVFRDSPCANCTYGLLIFGSKTPVYIDTTGRSADFAFPLAPLLAERKKTGSVVFNGYYTEYFFDSKRSRVVSFAVRLE